VSILLDLFYNEYLNRRADALKKWKGSGNKNPTSTFVEPSSCRRLKTYFFCNRQSIYDNLLLVTFLICTIVLLLHQQLAIHSVKIVIVFLLLLFLAIIIWKRSTRYKCEQKKISERYMTVRINPLIDLLKEYRYNTNDAISWLIQCCETVEANNIFIRIFRFVKGFMLVILFPVIAFFAGVLLNSKQVYEHFPPTLDALSWMFSITFGIFLFIEFNSTKRRELLDDLRYIKATLTTKKCKVLTHRCCNYSMSVRKHKDSRKLR